jgi:nuclear pore complex protein Nup188
VDKRSWTLVAAALSDRTGARQTTDALCEFLSNPYVQKLFEQPEAAFAAPTNQTDSEFEARTSAINVTPITNGKYDISTIKEDTRWLSRNAKINLVAALRIIAIEFQDRSASHLRGPLSLQDTINLQDAAGDSSNKSASRNTAFDDSASSDADTLWNKFHEPSSRRERLFATFLSEKESFYIAASCFHSVMLYGRLPWTKEKKPPINFHEVYKLEAFHNMARRDAAEVSKRILAAYLEILSGLNTELEVGPGGLVEDTILDSEATGQAWWRTMLKVALHSAEVVFQALDYDEKCVSAPPEMVGRWFGAMTPHCFFDSLPVRTFVAGSLPANSLTKRRS